MSLRPSRVCTLVSAFALLLAAAGRAVVLPALILTPHASRTRTEGVGPLPTWEVKWWIDVQGPAAAAPLTHIDYQARFGDGSDSRPLGGGWEVAAADASGFTGRVKVTCVVPTDYDRPVRVQMRVHDAAGQVSDWAEVRFPVDSEATDTQPDQTARVPGGGKRLGDVVVDVDDKTTIGQAKAALQHQAAAMGGDAVGFRLVSSSGTQSRFAADVISRPPATTVAPTPPPAASSERVVGEIVLPANRR
jgi:hypothetical protein